MRPCSDLSARWWWLPLALGLVSCAPSAGRAPLGAQCELTTECDDPLVCRLGRCRRECETIRDCPFLSRCVRDGAGLGACLLDDEASCALASDCPSPLVCAASRCVNECAEARDCPPGAVCDLSSGAGRCEEVEETRCAFDSDCAAEGLVCAPERRCRYACLGDRDCRIGQRCDARRCVPIGAGERDGGTSEDAGAEGDGGAMDGGASDASFDAGVDASFDAGPPDAGFDAGPLACVGECAAAPGAAAVDCIDGACVVTSCEAGFLDCDGDVRNGCEANPELHRFHCGACGRSCAAGEVCLAARCVGATLEELVVSEDDGFVQGSHACARWSTGHVSCWGLNHVGQLGDHGTTSRAVPVLVRDVDDAAGIAIGYAHSCVLRAGGAVWCWGSHDRSQLGDGSPTGLGSGSLTPVRVAGLDDAVQISAGNFHTCALRAGGGVVCWGEGSAGRLGSGSNLARSSPVPVVGLSGAAGEPVVRRVRAGSAGGCAFLEDGGARCWGDNSNGQLGNGSFGGTAHTPSPLTGLGPARDVFLGAATSVGATEDGALYCWGANGIAQACGLSRIDDRFLAPTLNPHVSGVVAVSARCALGGDGTISCWGDNGQGQAGNGGLETPLDLPTLATLGGARALASARRFACALVGPAAVRCTGDNPAGQLGNGRPGRAVLHFSPVEGLP
ncbi:MAG: hypothetical protein KF901_29970 [Myxococcales bacterium]|nr:hypothetical protein [Myxococcales bacterium]